MAYVMYGQRAVQQTPGKLLGLHASTALAPCLYLEHALWVLGFPWGSHTTGLYTH